MHVGDIDWSVHSNQLVHIRLRSRLFPNIEQPSVRTQSTTDKVIGRSTVNILAFKSADSSFRSDLGLGLALCIVIIVCSPQSSPSEITILSLLTAIAGKCFLTAPFGVRGRRWTRSCYCSGTVTNWSLHKAISALLYLSKYHIHSVLFPWKCV
ncbi:hypothetical protein QCA50_011748 [Cerrena zonata]|uniref:Uncharacterized protein n=1 Tax=Cerrena zonata TaxID=2478898 RepID=A0AAW0FZN2_9APHY